MSFNRVMAALLVALCLVAAVLSGSRPSLESAGRMSLPEGRGRILSLSLQGAISAGSSGGLLADGGSATALRSQLLAAAQDNRTRGILLRINSPGGTVGTSQEVYRAIRQVQAAGKPVIVSMQDVAASGGYYIASAADKIYANPGTLTGSIGVILQGLDVSQLIDSLGIAAKTYKTGSFKDILSPYRPETSQEASFLQDLVDNTLEQFIIDVAEGRQRVREGLDVIVDSEMLDLRAGMDIEQVRGLADGRIFTGVQALELGLVDALGGSDDALTDLRTLLDDQEERLSVETGSEMGLDQILRLLQSSASASSLLPELTNLWQGLTGSSLDPLRSVPVLWMSRLG
ncbi:MAG: signal peptide peptidase SppA [Synechococcaceae cyanobacterium SM2_3_2]|nr:signal peptide peptidase SppA [Synechococcaceae cyanobacterium SM2_3_2]